MHWNLVLYPSVHLKVIKIFMHILGKGIKLTSLQAMFDCMCVPTQLDFSQLC